MDLDTDLPLFSEILAADSSGQISNDDITAFVQDYIEPRAPWLQWKREGDISSEEEELEDQDIVLEELEAEMLSGIQEGLALSLSDDDDADVDMDEATSGEGPLDSQLEEETETQTLDVSEILHLSHAYPPSIDGAFSPSDFQKAILDYMETYRTEIGHKVGLLELATAQGKTILSLLDIEREIEKRDEDKAIKVLFLVHTVNIRDSAYQKFKRHFTAKRRFKYASADFCQVNSMSSSSSNSSASVALQKDLKRATFVFCLFQSFKRMSDPIVSSFTHIIIDETHHVMASSYASIHRLLLSSRKIEYMLGMTATLLHRDDPSGSKIKSMFRNVLYVSLPWTICKKLNMFPSVEYLEVIDSTLHMRNGASYDQLLHDYCASDSYSLSQFLRKLSQSLRAAGLDTHEAVIARLTPDYIADKLFEYQYQRLLAGLPPKQRIIVFCRTTEDCDRVADLLNMKCSGQEFQFQDRLVAPAVSAHYRRRDVQRAISAFVSGKVRVLCSVLMVNEGFDLPSVDCAVLGRLTESEIVFAQQMGRGLRIDEDQPDKEFTVLDLSMNLRRRWHRLFGELPAEEVKNQIKCFWHVGNFVGTIS